MLEMIQQRFHKIHKFQPKTEIVTDKGPYILKTVTNSNELLEALKLRYQVFYREMLGKKKSTGVDIDEYDLICDHLVIIDKKSSKIVGTYRLNSSLNSRNFYSASEFNLRRILETSGSKLELGRACIHKDFRKGPVISLLWRGIAQYMVATNSSLLFGCASIKTEDPREAALLYRYFWEQGYINSKFFAPPTQAFAMPDLTLWIAKLSHKLTESEITEAEDLIPSLCKSYLKAGAYIGGEPAYDKDFRCIDFLTILPRENLNKTIWRKYGQEAEEETAAEKRRADRLRDNEFQERIQLPLIVHAGSI